MIFALLSCVAQPDTGLAASPICANEDRGDPLEVGATFTAGAVHATVVALEPDPVVVGENRWTLDLSEPDCEVQVSALMPDHGHGATLEGTTVQGTEVVVEGLHLTMGGYWELTLDLSCGDAQESLTVPLCVEP